MFRLFTRGFRLGTLAGLAPLACRGPAVPAWCGTNKHDMKEKAIKEELRREEYKSAMEWCTATGATPYAAEVRLVDPEDPDSGRLWPTINAKSLAKRIAGIVCNEQPHSRHAALTKAEEGA